MAWEFAYGGLVKTYWKVYFYYNWEPKYSDTQSRLTWYYGIYWPKSVAGNDTDNNYMCKYDSASYVSCTGQTKKTTYPSSITLTQTWWNADADKCYAYGSGTYYFNRTSADQTVTVIAYINHNSNGTKYKGSSIATKSFTVPVRDTYTVSFNANTTDTVSGLSGDLSALYGSPITLPAGPTRSNWDFKAWCVNSDGSGTLYYPNTSYTVWSTHTLRAIWSYTLPVLSNINASRVIKNQNNTYEDNDEGGYLKLSFDYSSGHTQTSNPTTSLTVTLNNEPLTLDSGTASFSGTGTNKTLYYIIPNECTTDNSYPLLITLTEPGHINCATFTLVLASSIYPIDLASNGTNMKLGLPTVAKQQLYFLIDDSVASGEDFIINTSLNDLGWTDIIENQ